MNQKYREEILRQILWLEGEIASHTIDLRILDAEVQHMESSLNSFIMEYYGEVGWMFEVQKAEKTINHEPSTMNQNNNFSFSFTDFSSEEAMKNEIKRTYRKLVKLCHPDLRPSDPDALYAFSMLTKSYENNDLYGLVKIENALFAPENEENEPLVVKLERLEREHQAVQNSLDKMKIRKFKLINSPEYKLQQCVRWHKICGDDLIARVKDRAAGKSQNPPAGL